MRNKGFFWFLTILLCAVCVYQLSFTYVSTNVEKDAAKEAEIRVDEEFAKAKAAGEDSLDLPNNTTVAVADPESFDLAVAAYLNQILKEKSTVKVYPVLGSTFQEAKSRSLAFGLDLVGGMSVTLEISVPDLIKSYARNQRALTFKRPYEAALAIHQNRGTDFIDAFQSEYEKMNGSRKMVQDLDIQEITELRGTSTNNEVVSFFRKKVSSSMDGVEQIMNKRINQFGVAQPNIQKDSRSNRLYIELPGVQDEITVTEKLKSTANLQFFETYQVFDIQGALVEGNNLSRLPERKIEEPEMQDTSAVVTDSTKTDSNVAAAPAAPAEPIAAPLKNTKSFLELVTGGQGAIIGNVLPENRMAVEKILKRRDFMALFPEDLRFMWSANLNEGMAKGSQKTYQLYAIKVPADGKAPVGGSDVSYASKSRNQQTNAITVDLSMTVAGAQKWGDMTSANVGKNVAITMDEVVYSAPTVNEAIRNGNTQISGNFTITEAEDLAGLLNGGALPAPCVIKDQSKVGPTIGAENSRAGLISFGIAFLAVFAYMYFYYGKGGLVANIALAVNVILIFGSLASFGAVLTLAGIAGIVLTIGTAVDANILIFERIREEIRAGMGMAEAVQIGFSKALPSIIDANVTHLLVAIILKVFGTGEIESFATTLIIGIFTSVFSAIVVSKLIITSQVEKGKAVSFNTNMSKGLFQNFHFDWIGKRKYFYIFSITITILGVIALFTRGLKPSVEFTGGTTYGVKFDKKADNDFIERELSKVFREKNGEVSSIEIKTKSNAYNVEITTNYLLNDDDASNKVTAKLKEGLDNTKDKLGNYEIVETRRISNTVANEMLSSATLAITLSLIAIFAYILIRFGQWQYSIGAILGLAHDVLVVLSIFACLHGFLPFSLDVNQAFVAAVLTVIGYSMNDTVIVFDRIRENLNANKNTDDHGRVINSALNTTLSRTFNTSMILFVVLLIMFIFGGPAIKGFLFALLVGVLIGTYSSLCVATPILVDFNKRFKIRKSEDPS
jgi:SecD/SecF fusion protein